MLTHQKFLFQKTYSSLSIRSAKVNDLTVKRFGVPGCRSLLRLDKEVRREGERLSYDVRYFIRSLDPCVVSASAYQDLILRGGQAHVSSSGTRSGVDSADEYGIVCGEVNAERRANIEGTTRTNTG